MSESELFDRLESASAALPPINARLPEESDLDEWARLPNAELRQRISTVTASFAEWAEGAVMEAKFFLSLIRWSLARDPQPFGLSGTRALLEARARSVLDSRDERGALGDVQGDRGLQNGLIFFGRFVPIGLYHADVGSVPRSLWRRLSVGESLNLARYLLLDMRGEGPTVGIHLPKLSSRRLTESDYIEAHLAAASLFEANPRLRGFYNTAWYYDPKLAEISPHLAFLPRFACEHGALRLRLGSDVDSMEDATWKSRTRRRLYLEGRYVPTRYARLWAREPFLTWAGSAP